MTSSPRGARPVTRSRSGTRHSLSQALRNVRQRAQAHVQPQAPASPPPQQMIQEDPQEAAWKKMRLCEQNAGEFNTFTPQLERTLWAYVYPQFIQATEAYFYQVKISGRPDIRLMDDPRGEVRIETPYDGFEYFTLDAARELAGRLGSASGAINGQLGWLAISAPLDWEHDGSCPPGADMLPVTIPLRGENLVRDELWTADEVRAVAQYGYAPDDLAFWPVSVDVHVYDDVLTSVEDIRDYVDLLVLPKETPGGEEQLALDLVVTAFVPSALCKADDDVCVRLERLTLAWPTIATPWQIQMCQNTGHGASVYNQAIKWRYNPDLGTVEAYNLLARRDEPEAGSPLTPFRCEVRLLLRGASQIIEQDELVGAVRLCVEGALLSGRQVNWLATCDTDARLPEAGQAVCHRTILEAGFTAGWRERLEHRCRATWRRWRFTGAGLCVERMTEIAAALCDLGYQVQKQGMDAGGERGVLVATRAAALPPCQVVEEPVEWQGRTISRAALPAGPRAESGRAVLHVDILAERTAPTRVWLERETPEGARLSAEIETSDLILYARGRTQEATNLVALDMEQLMVMLKKRFSDM